MKIPDSLEKWFKDCPAAITAFSGGVDSSLVAWLAHHYLGPQRHTAIISASPSLKLSDLDEAKRFATRHGMSLKVIETEELSNPDYFLNPANRCFFCKQTLYGDLESLARKKRPCWILNGTNTDDRGDYRPGLKAADAFRVRSPLAECDFGKEDVRSLAEDLDLECWNKPAAPCLSSRIPYGQRVTVDKLRRIEQAEAWLTGQGFPVNRVRHLEHDVARVEVPESDLEKFQSVESIMPAAFKKLGFTAVETDPEGFESGKLNRALKTVPRIDPAPVRD